MLTVVLTKTEVSRHLRALHLLQELRTAFLEHRHLAASAPVTFEVAGAGSARVRHGSLSALRRWSITVQPSTTAAVVLQLYDRDSGELLALMDAGHLMALRASVVGALAADALAAPQASSVALLGNGPVVSSALKALRLVRSLGRVTLFDPDLAASTQQAMALHASLAVNVRACETAEEAVRGAEIVVLTGAVDLPVDAVADGAHLTILGADGLSDAPLPPSLLARARCFSDDRQASVPWAPAFVGDLGQVLAGTVPARAEASQVTLFVSLGPPTLDLIAAAHVYEGARDDEALTRVELKS